jgi:hypothetical protein
MIVKKKIDYYCGNVVHTKGKDIEVVDLKSELSIQALKEYKKFNSVCYNGFLYSEKIVNSGGYIGETENINLIKKCKCIKFRGGSKWFKNGCEIHE